MSDGFSPGSTPTAGLAPLANAPAAAFVNSHTFVSGVGKLIDATAARFLYVPVTFNPTGIATATCEVAISTSPNETVYQVLSILLMPALAALGGLVDAVTLRVPAGHYVRLTAVNVTLGTGKSW